MYQESAGASGLKAPSGGGGGGMKSQPGGAYNQVFDFGAPQTQGGGVKDLLA